LAKFQATKVGSKIAAAMKGLEKEDFMGGGTSQAAAIAVRGSLIRARTG